MEALPQQTTDAGTVMDSQGVCRSRNLTEHVTIEQLKASQVNYRLIAENMKNTGLGLMISHRILVEHGGNLSIESEREKGTTVHITLPARLV